jgi:exosortase/archaeosortase family protein
MNKITQKELYFFIIKFIVLFLFFYFTSWAVIGLSSPEDHYSPFVSHYLNYVNGIRHTLIWGAKIVAGFFGYQTIEGPDFLIKVIGGKGVRVNNSCVGYGILSFWAAFVIAVKLPIYRKLTWAIGGLFIIWLINVVRIGVFLVSVNNEWGMPFGLDHHTWFNILAYTAIFVMLYFFDKKNKNIQA